VTFLFPQSLADQCISEVLLRTTSESVRLPTSPSCIVPAAEATEGEAAVIAEPRPVSEALIRTPSLSGQISILQHAANALALLANIFTSRLLIFITIVVLLYFGAEMWDLTVVVLAWVAGARVLGLWGGLDGPRRSTEIEAEAKKLREASHK
jgi:hypothetical protein